MQPSKGIKLELERVKVTVDAILFDLEGIDMVLGISWLVMLGISWLATLGKMIVDWGTQTMICQLYGEWVELKGEGNNRFAQIVLQSIFARPKRMVEGLFLLNWKGFR